MGNGVQKRGDFSLGRSNSIRPWVGPGEVQAKRGAFEPTASPRSVSLLRRTYEPQESDARAQDDSVVYAESKSSRHAARLRPQRRGESFSVRSTSKRPTSWHPADTSAKSNVVCSLRTPASPLRGATSNADKSKSGSSPTSPVVAADAPGMQFGGAVPSSSDSLSMASYSSFQSLQNLGPAKSTPGAGPMMGAAAPPGGLMSSSVSWHGAGSASQPVLNRPPPVEPRRKLQNNGTGYGVPGGAPRDMYGPRSHPRTGHFPEKSPDSSHVGYLSYSQSQGQLPMAPSTNMTHQMAPPTAAQSLQDIRSRVGAKEYAYSGWSRPTPYKPNNYENIDAFEAARSNAAAESSHASLIQAQAYSHSYSNFAQSRTISDDGFVHHHHPPDDGSHPNLLPPEIPPWPQSDHRKMLSEDSGVELSMTSPPPPLPPGRDDSRGHHHLLQQPSRSQERLSSWPSAYQPTEEPDMSRTGPRAHSWSAYQPRLNAHKEEKQEYAHHHHHHHPVIGNGESGGAVDPKGEVELKNLYNAKPSYPGYGYETNYDVFSASKKDNVHSKKETTTAVDDLFQYANKTSREMSGQSPTTGHSRTSPPPPLPQTAPPLPHTAPPLPHTAPPLPQTAPPLPQTAPPPMPQKGRTSSSSSTGSGHTIIVRQKPFYNTATQTEMSPASPPTPPAAPAVQYPRPVPAPRTAVHAEPAFRNVEIQVDMDLVMVTPSATPMSTLERRKLKKADQGCQVQPSMLPETLTNAGHVQHVPENYAEVSSFHRTAPIVDKLTQEKRIPETIREESPKKYEAENSELCNPTQEVKDNILQSIHDHSPSQTSIMRKLSREFFGNQMKSVPYTSHPTLSAVPEVQRTPPAGEPPLLRQSKEYWSPPPSGEQENNKVVVNKPPPSGAEQGKEGEPVKDGKKKMDRSKKLSLRKAFGIFDEIESVDDPNSRRFLSSHGKSMSASHVGSARNQHIYQELKEVPAAEEKPLRWYNRPKGDEIHKDAHHQRYDSGHFSQEESGNSNKMSAKSAFNENHVKKLHRTSSEQIRPVKERLAERERSMEQQAMCLESVDMRDKRHKLSDPLQRHKNSDPLEYNGKVPSGNGGTTGHRASDPAMEEFRKPGSSQHRLSDPASSQRDKRLSDPASSQRDKRLSDPASSQRDKRLSGDSDLFRGPYESSSLQRRPSSGRSTSSSSLDGHRFSDPELKKMQHMAVLNFFEMKTGKRLSSSSMDSSGNSKYNSLSSRGSSSIDSAVGLYRERSPSPNKSPEDPSQYTQDHPASFSALKKSKSLPRDMASHAEDGVGLSLPPEPAPSIDTERCVSARDLTATRDATATRDVPATRDPATRERRRSGSGSSSRWVHHAKEKSAPSQMESYHVVPLESTGSTTTTPTTTTAATTTGEQSVHTAETSAVDSQLSPVGSTSPDAGECSMDANLTLPKQTYDYSSSSSGSSSPTKSPGTSAEFAHKFSSYHVTTNKTYADSDGSPPPPVLPPRNYRAAPGPGPAPTEHRFRPPPTPPQSTSGPSSGSGSISGSVSGSAAAYQSDVMGGDFNTPQPDHYANQLRQQMRKQFSQSGVGAARLQSKTLAEVKQNVAMSRPVDRPPAPQEAVAPPQPMPRSTTLPELNVGADGFGYPDGTKSAREVTSHKVDVMHVSSGKSSPQQQQQPQQQQPHLNHHSHHVTHQHQQQQQHHPSHNHQILTQSQQPQQQQQQQHIHPQSQHQSHQYHPAHHHMTQSHSMTNIHFRSSEAAPVGGDRNSLSRLPVGDRNSPKERRRVETTPSDPPPPPPPAVAPSGGLAADSDETLEKLPLPPSSPPPEMEEDARRRLSFDDEADVCTKPETSQRYSNESYMTKRNNPRQGFNGNYRRSNSNEIPKAGGTTPTTPPALTATSTPQLITSASGARRDATGSAAPSSPVSANPPKTETLVKVATVMTVNKSLPAAESKTQLEAGPTRSPATSGSSSGSGHHNNHHHAQPRNTPPPVPPKYGRVAGIVPVMVATPEKVVGGSQERLASPAGLGLDSTPPDFVLSGRPGVTNLDEASSLLNQLNSARRAGAGSPGTGNSSSNSSGLAAWTPKATTPPTTDTPTSLTSSQERLGPVSHTALNGHDTGTHASPETPPPPPACPPPACPPSADHDAMPSAKEAESWEEKEQAATPPPEAPVEPEVAAPEPEKEPQKAAEKGPLGSPIHVRQKSYEEIECEKVAAVVAIQIVDDDKQLSDVILPPPEHKMASDFMLGLFDTCVDDLPTPAPSIRSPQSHREDARRSMETSPAVGSAYWSPPSVASLQNKMREEGIEREQILREMGAPDTSLQRQKEELEARIKQKLDILRSEKEALREDISDNEQLGKEVTVLVKEKVQNKGEFDKYKLYVDELDKVMFLLLNLSGRLARAENAVMSLHPDADESEKMTLTSKRDEASEKHSDAKLLKQGIDRRSEQVSSFLHRYLTESEFDSYRYFIKMKSKLTMEQQEIDDKIKLGNEQLRALKRSMQR